MQTKTPKLGLSAKPTKTPWRLRLAIAILALGGILLAPLLPHLAAQSNSPTNNSPTNSVHRDV